MGNFDCDEIFMILLMPQEYFTGLPGAQYLPLAVAAVLKHWWICSRLFLWKMWESRNMSRNTPWHIIDSPSKFHQNCCPHLGAVGQKRTIFTFYNWVFLTQNEGMLGCNKIFIIIIGSHEYFLCYTPEQNVNSLVYLEPWNTAAYVANFFSEECGKNLQYLGTLLGPNLVCPPSFVKIAAPV